MYNVKLHYYKVADLLTLMCMIVRVMEVSVSGWVVGSILIVSEDGERMMVTHWCGRPVATGLCPGLWTPVWSETWGRPDPALQSSASPHPGPHYNQEQKQSSLLCSCSPALSAQFIRTSFKLVYNFSKEAKFCKVNGRWQIYPLMILFDIP